MKAPLETFHVTDVFVPGGQPTITYVPRSSLGLEEHVRDYLAERHRILSLSGPTKSGKTVLLKSILAGVPHVWISGGEITTLDRFWERLADELDTPTATQTSRGSEETTTTSKSATGGVAPAGIGFQGGFSSQTGAARLEGTLVTRTRSVAGAARKALLDRQLPLVIDDFHYINPAVQLEIVRTLKDPIFNGVPVIVVAVPHRAYDSVRIETEMTGRVEQLPIAFWSAEELRLIPREGFAALNVVADDELLDHLIREAFQSPHLMQDFCLGLCKDNGVRETQAAPRGLELPDLTGFLRARVVNASKTAFDLLSRGPRQRKDRITRQLKDGSSTDIYGAVLAAIAATGPLTELKYEDLRRSLREVMLGGPPQGPEVTRVLVEMNKIAREKIEGEPVVDWDAGLGTLFISDPFFAFYLRWGVRA
jgi:hypothetical protein